MAVLAAAALLGAACDAGPDPAADGAEREGGRPSADRAKAADGRYHRELTFLAAEGRRALVYASAANVTGGGGEVRSRAWADDGSGWRGLVDESRRFAELREPWRLFPLGAARLVVGDDGALALMTLPGPRGALRLRPISPPTQLSTESARIGVREATLTTPEDSIVGVLVDVTAVFEPEDSARVALRGVLTSLEGPLVVLVSAPTGVEVLVADVGEVDPIESAIRLEPGVGRGEWRILSADTGVVGTLRPLDGGDGAPGDAVSVSGRLALAGTLYPLAGVLRVPATPAP
ncbi:MAG: hypothetical protein ABFS34_12535 [Gemmatimonadota bacterium]